MDTPCEYPSKSFSGKSLLHRDIIPMLSEFVNRGFLALFDVSLNYDGDGDKTQYWQLIAQSCQIDTIYGFYGCELRVGWICLSS
jgi:hypothetical protein